MCSYITEAAMVFGCVCVCARVYGCVCVGCASNHDNIIKYANDATRGEERMKEGNGPFGPQAEGIPYLCSLLTSMGWWSRI